MARADNQDSPLPTFFSATPLRPAGRSSAAAAERARAARLREVHKVLEAGVEVRLLAQRAHVAEVAVVHVRVHAEQALEDRAHHRPEVRREGLAVLLREHARVVQLRAARRTDFLAPHTATGARQQVCMRG